MLSAFSVSQVRQAEEQVAARTGWDALMQAAAAGLAEVALRHLPQGARPLVLVGPGNNGGDALFATVRLRAAGFAVDLALLDPDQVHAGGLAAATSAGARIVDGPTDQHGHVIDAVFGIGARPGLTDRAAEWASWQQRTTPWTLAVDVPSGVDVDGGTLPGVALRADRTVTFGALKPALLVGPAADLAGVIEVVDLGLGPHLGAPVLEAIEPSDGLAMAASLQRDGVEHKYTRGVLGVRAGSAHYPGAAHLVVAGAQAGPAGMIRFLGSPDLAARVVDHAPEVIAAPGRVQAHVVGPGAADEAADALTAARADDVPLVIDADALAALTEPLDRPAVLTPHAGELARLRGIERETVEADPWGQARAAARQWSATVLLKGPRTVIVDPDDARPARVNLSGTRWLGTAGSGDVLAGLTGAWLAAGADPLTAASVAAYLHGAAGVSANPGGPITASAIARALPAVTAAFFTGVLDHPRDW